MASIFSIESIGSQIGLGEADLKDTTLNILRWSLGFLTLAAVVFFIIGAADRLISGDSDVVKIRARRIMIGAVAGMIVVLLGWAIVFFVARTTANVTVNT